MLHLFFLLVPLSLQNTLDDYDLDDLTLSGEYAIHFFTYFSHLYSNVYALADETTIIYFNFRKATSAGPSCGTCSPTTCAVATYSIDDPTECACYGDIENESYTINDTTIRFTCLHKLFYIFFFLSHDYCRRCRIYCLWPYRIYRFNLLGYNQSNIHFEYVCFLLFYYFIFLFLSLRFNLTITWNTPKACVSSSSSSGLGVGSIILIIIAVIVVLYFVIGIPVMRFAFKKTGLEMIPFFNFWKGVGMAVVDGVRFIFSPCIRSSGAGDYQTVHD